MDKKNKREVKNDKKQKADEPIMSEFFDEEGMEATISSAYCVYDTDLARDNLENNLSAADLQDV